jgi:hypothetical protein
MWDHILFMTPLTWRKFLHVGPCKILRRVGTLYFRKNTYMWDHSEFYDDLEHSIFKIIMLTCGTKVGLRRCCGACGVTKLAWTRECSATSPIVMTKVFLSLNLLESEIL